MSKIDQLVLREAMVLHQIESRGVQDKQVLAALRKVERHRFVPSDQQTWAYADSPLAIGYNQTISQPYIVAYMTELLKLSKNDRVLEIGSGCGYQTAVLAEIVSQVYAMEIIELLYKKSKKVLDGLGYHNIKMQCGNGHFGWPAQSPFDAILVAAAPEYVPEVLLDQLTDGGRLVIPVGKFSQDLFLITRQGNNFIRKKMLPVRFVPMTGDTGES